MLYDNGDPARLSMVEDAISDTNLRAITVLVTSHICGRTHGSGDASRRRASCPARGVTLVSVP